MIFQVNDASERPGETQTLLAIAATLGGAPDVTEVLRQTCRHLARFTGAETISAHMLDPGRTALIPIAAYHVPKEALLVRAGELLPIDAQGFRDSILAGEMDAAVEAARRIAEIIAHMGRITRLEVHGQTPSVPPVLDIRGSGPSEPR